MITVGIDAGVEYTKAVVLLKDGSYEFSVINNGFDPAATVARKAVDQVLQKANLSENQIDAIVKTGMSRKDLDFEGMEISDTVCLGEGAGILCPEQAYVMDAGVRKFGVVHMENGSIAKVSSMDKCASGAGACLNMVSAFLNLDLDTMNDMYFRATQNIELETKCAVFAESEIISRIHKKVPVEEIVHGVFMGLARRCQSPLIDVGATERILIVGGVSRIPAFLDAMTQISQMEICTIEHPQIVIALGAASLARRIGG